MDSVRFGRALGLGARGAVKAALIAADAAASSKPAPEPRPAAQVRSHEAPTQDAKPNRIASVSQSAARAAEQLRQAKAGVRRGGRQFGGAVWEPFVRLSGVLWLEVMAVFFGLFMLTAGINVWKLRGQWHDVGANHTVHQHLLFSIAMLAVFGYFCISSFVRAARRGRRGK